MSGWRKCDICKRRIHLLKEPYAIQYKRWVLCKSCFLKYGDDLPYIFYGGSEEMKRKKLEALEALGITPNKARRTYPSPVSITENRNP